MNVSVQAALALNGQVNPIPMDGAWKGSEWKLYTVYTCWIALELVVVYFFYVKTKYVIPTFLSFLPFPFSALPCVVLVRRLRVLMLSDQKGTHARGDRQDL